VKYGVQALPTLLVFKGGEVVSRSVGAVSKGVLAGKLEEALL